MPNKSSRFSIVKSAVGTLRIEHSVTADMADGQPLPPLIEDGEAKKQAAVLVRPISPPLKPSAQTKLEVEYDDDIPQF